MKIFEMQSESLQVESIDASELVKLPKCPQQRKVVTFSETDPELDEQEPEEVYNESETNRNNEDDEESID